MLLPYPKLRGSRSSLANGERTSVVEPFIRAVLYESRDSSPGNLVADQQDISSPRRMNISTGRSQISCSPISHGQCLCPRWCRSGGAKVARGKTLASISGKPAEGTKHRSSGAAHLRDRTSESALEVASAVAFGADDRAEKESLKTFETRVGPSLSFWNSCIGDSTREDVGSQGHIVAGRGHQDEYEAVAPPRQNGLSRRR